MGINYNSQNYNSNEKRKENGKVVSTYTKPERLPDIEMNMPLYVDNLAKIMYNPISVEEIMHRGNFEEFSQQICLDNKYINDYGKKGTKAVGFIKSFNAETREFTVSIFGASEEAINKCKTDGQLMIKPRVLFDKETGNAKTVIGFNVVAVE